MRKLMYWMVLASSLILLVGGVLHFFGMVDLKHWGIAVAWIIVGLSNGVRVLGWMRNGTTFFY